MTHHRDELRGVVDEMSARLRTDRIGRCIRSFDVVTSTNELALTWAAEGAPHGAVVYAEYQRRGRGRMGRSWSARAGVNLTFSVVLRPQLAPERLGMITIAAGVAVAEAIDDFSDPVHTQIKWPNDILLDGKKCCGMLLESRVPIRGRESSRTVVLGIGINVNQDAFPDDLEDRASSILLATGRTASRPDLFATVLERLEDRLDLLNSDERALRRRYMVRMRDLNAPIELRLTERGRTIRGVATGLDEAGGLLMATEEGMRAYHAGEVTRSA